MSACDTVGGIGYSRKLISEYFIWLNLDVFQEVEIGAIVFMGLIDWSIDIGLKQARSESLQVW